MLLFPRLWQHPDLSSGTGALPVPQCGRQVLAVFNEKIAYFQTS